MTDQPVLFEVDRKVEKAPERRAKRIANFMLFVYGNHSTAIRMIEKDIEAWKAKHEREMRDWLSIPEYRRVDDFGKPQPYLKEIQIEERAIEILKRETPIEGN